MKINHQFKLSALSGLTLLALAGCQDSNPVEANPITQNEPKWMIPGDSNSLSVSLQSNQFASATSSLNQSFNVKVQDTSGCRNRIKVDPQEQEIKPSELGKTFELQAPADDQACIHQITISGDGIKTTTNPVAVPYAHKADIHLEKWAGGSAKQAQPGDFIYLTMMPASGHTMSQTQIYHLKSNTVGLDFIDQDGDIVNQITCKLNQDQSRCRVKLDLHGNISAGDASITVDNLLGENQDSLQRTVHLTVDPIQDPVKTIDYQFVSKQALPSGDLTLKLISQGKVYGTKTFQASDADPFVRDDGSVVYEMNLDSDNFDGVDALVPGQYILAVYDGDAMLGASLAKLNPDQDNQALVVDDLNLSSVGLAALELSTAGTNQTFPEAKEKLASELGLSEYSIDLYPENGTQYFTDNSISSDYVFDHTSTQNQILKSVQSSGEQDLNIAIAGYNVVSSFSSENPVAIIKSLVTMIEDLVSASSTTIDYTADIKDLFALDASIQKQINNIQHTQKEIASEITADESTTLSNDLKKINGLWAAVTKVQQKNPNFTNLSASQIDNLQKAYNNGRIQHFYETYKDIVSSSNVYEDYITALVNQANATKDDLYPKDTTGFGFDMISDIYQPYNLSLLSEHYTIITHMQKLLTLMVIYSKLNNLYGDSDFSYKLGLDDVNYANSLETQKDSIVSIMTPLVNDTNTLTKDNYVSYSLASGLKPGHMPKAASLDSYIDIPSRVSDYYNDHSGDDNRVVWNSAGYTVIIDKTEDKFSFYPNFNHTTYADPKDDRVRSGNGKSDGLILCGLNQFSEYYQCEGELDRTLGIDKSKAYYGLGYYCPPNYSTCSSNNGSGWGVILGRYEETDQSNPAWVPIQYSIGGSQKTTRMEEYVWEDYDKMKVLLRDLWFKKVSQNGTSQIDTLAKPYFYTGTSAARQSGVSAFGGYYRLLNMAHVDLSNYTERKHEPLSFVQGDWAKTCYRVEYALIGPDVQAYCANPNEGPVDVDTNASHGLPVNITGDLGNNFKVDQAFSDFPSKSNILCYQIDTSESSNLKQVSC